MQVLVPVQILEFMELMIIIHITIRLILVRFKSLILGRIILNISLIRMFILSLPQGLYGVMIYIIITAVLILLREYELVKFTELIQIMEQEPLLEISGKKG